MSDQYPSVEAFIEQLKKETSELAEQILDGRERRILWASIAAALVSKVLESLPGMQIKDASEARELVEEAEELLRMTLEELHKLRSDGRPKGPSFAPSLN